MKKGCFSILLLMLLLFSGCRENAVVISDQYWERYVENDSTAYPDWKAIVRKAGYNPKVLIKPPNEEEWSEISRDLNPAFLLWGPFWVEEALEFSINHPDIRSLAAFPPTEGREILKNISHLSPLRLEAFRETGKRLSKAAGSEGKVLSIFYVGDSEREAEYTAFLDGIAAGPCEHEGITFRRQENIQSAQDFLDKFTGESVLFLFIAGGGKTQALFDDAKKKISGRIMVEIPDLPGNDVEENPSIMHYSWEDTIISIIEDGTEKWERDYNVPISIQLWVNEN